MVILHKEIEHITALYFSDMPSILGPFPVEDMKRTSSVASDEIDGTGQPLGLGEYHPLRPVRVQPT